MSPLALLSYLAMGLFPVAPQAVDLPVAALFLAGLRVADLVQAELLAAAPVLEVLLAHQVTLINLNIQITNLMAAKLPPKQPRRT